MVIDWSDCLLVHQACGGIRTGLAPTASISRIVFTNASASTKEPYSPSGASDPSRALLKTTLTPAFSSAYDLIGHAPIMARLRALPNYDE